MNATGSSPDTVRYRGTALATRSSAWLRWTSSDDASAESGAREPRAERARLDECLDEEIELGCRDLEVVAQAAVAREQQRAERVHVAGPERVGELEHAARSR